MSLVNGARMLLCQFLHLVTHLLPLLIGGNNSKVLQILPPPRCPHPFPLPCDKPIRVTKRALDLADARNQPPDFLPVGGAPHGKAVGVPAFAAAHIPQRCQLVELCPRRFQVVMLLKHRQDLLFSRQVLLNRRQRCITPRNHQHGGALVLVCCRRFCCCCCHGRGPSCGTAAVLRLDLLRPGQLVVAVTEIAHQHPVALISNR